MQVETVWRGQRIFKYIDPITPAPTYDLTHELEPPIVTFNDILASAYYSEAVSRAVVNGVTSGVGPGWFGPDLRCTRTQMGSFLWKAQSQRRHGFYSFLAVLVLQLAPGRHLYLAHLGLPRSVNPQLSQWRFP